MHEGIFAEALGDGIDLELQTFNAGSEAIEALVGGSIDATSIGPNPAINGWAESDGGALRIVAGTTSRGASLVVREGTESPADLAGTTLASPALGNTQDAALRAWSRRPRSPRSWAGSSRAGRSPGAASWRASCSSSSAVRSRSGSC